MDVNNYFPYFEIRENPSIVKYFDYKDMAWSRLIRILIRSVGMNVCVNPIKEHIQL